MKDFKLDNIWHCEITDESREVLNDWRKNIIKYSSEDCKYNYIDQIGSGGFFHENKQLITFEQFKKYVLQQSKVSPDETNYEYLISILEKLNK